MHRDLICRFFLSTLTISTTKKLGWSGWQFFAGIAKVFLTTINSLIHKRKFVTTRCADSDRAISAFSDWIMMLLCTGDSRLWVNCKTLEKMVIIILQHLEFQGHFMLTILNFNLVENITNDLSQSCYCVLARICFICLFVVKTAWAMTRLESIKECCHGS